MDVSILAYPNGVIGSGYPHTPSTVRIVNARWLTRSLRGPHGDLDPAFRRASSLRGPYGNLDPIYLRVFTQKGLSMVLPCQSVVDLRLDGASQHPVRVGKKALSRNWTDPVATGYPACATV